MITYADMSETERDLYLQALVEVARADSGLDDGEIDFYLDIASKLGVEASTANLFLTEGSLDLDRLLLVSRPVGTLILRDMSAMAVINNALTDGEEAVVFKVGKALKFQETEINEFLDWAYMGLQWQLASTRLLEKYAGV